MSTRTDRSALVPAIAAAVRRHPVGAFLTWSFTVGQAIAFIPLLAQWTTGTGLPTEPYLLVATAVGLVLPTLTITWITDGNAGLQGLAFPVLGALGLLAIAMTRGRLGHQAHAPVRLLEDGKALAMQGHQA